MYQKKALQTYFGRVVSFCFRKVCSQEHIFSYIIFCKEFSCSGGKYVKRQVIENRVGDSWIYSICNLCWTVSTTLYTSFSFNLIEHPRMSARKVNVHSFFWGVCKCMHRNLQLQIHSRQANLTFTEPMPSICPLILYSFHCFYNYTE